jgi:hypothetical protein
LVKETPHELRIPVFEQTVNGSGHTKACCPKDLDEPSDIVDRVVEDWTCSPFLNEWTETPTDESADVVDPYWEFTHKYGTYWRWVRPVFDGPTRSQANARIEFRPLPAQPTVRDSMALTVAFAGAMEGLTRTEHPVVDLPWETARDNFYAAMRDGLAADITWLTGDGSETMDLELALTDLLEHAAEGLRAVGLDREAVDRYLQPLQWRIETGVTPAGWKREQVRQRLDSGDSLAEAIQSTQRLYIENQAATLVDGEFSDW